MPNSLKEDFDIAKIDQGNMKLHQEYEAGRAELVHCPTKDMLADALTKLAPAPVIQVLHDAMNGFFPHCRPLACPVELVLMDDAGEVIPGH